MRFNSNPRDFLHFKLNKVEGIRITIILCFGFGILYSYKLWITDRLFPLAPICSELDNQSVTLGWLLFIVLLSSLLCYSLSFKRWVLAMFLAVLGILLLLDQNRIQPWVHFYGLLLLFFLEKNDQKAETNIISAVQVLIICMYLWGGIQKLNESFFESDFSRTIIDLAHLPEDANGFGQRVLAYLIPITEILAGILLSVRISRKLGFYISIILHSSIIVLLSPLGLSYDYIVIPWNLAILVLNYLVFYNNKMRINVTTWRHYLLVFVVGFLPVLNYFNLMDDFVSFSLYSFKNKLFYIAVSDKYWPVLKDDFENVLIEGPDSASGGHVIDINKWSYSELNVPVAPETRIYKQISRHFCRFKIPNSDLIFLMYRQPLKNENLIKWTCGN